MGRVVVWLALVLAGTVRLGPMAFVRRPLRGGSQQARASRAEAGEKQAKQSPASRGRPPVDFPTLISFLSTIKIEELWWIFVVLISFFSKKDN
jgi:hypothetical protein